MPKLPSEADLGAASAPRVAGPVSGYQVSGDDAAVERATAQLGKTIENVGDAIYRIDKQLTKARQASQLTDAVGRATGEVGELEITHQRDQDFKTSPTRFTQSAQLIGQKYEALIDDPAVKEAFKLRYRDISTSKRLNVIQHAAKQEGDYNVAALDRNTSIYATNAANAANSAEREIVINQFRIDLANMQRYNWITDEDAGKREREFLGKIDQAIVTRDMTADPANVATKLATDPEYAANIDQKQRATLIDQAWRRAESDDKQRDAVAERERKRMGDEHMKEALNRQDAGTLDRGYVERIRSFIEPTEYRSLLAGLSGADRKDDPAAFAEIQGLLYTNPVEAEKRALTYHRNGRIRNETLSSTLSRARELGRQEGPRSGYERERQFITNAIKPSDLVPDPAGSARYAVVIREFDDYAGAANRSDADLRTKADDLLKKYTMIDMVELARRSALSAQPTPAQQLETIRVKGEDLIAQKNSNKITEAVYTREMEKLNKARKAAEKAQANGGK